MIKTAWKFSVSGAYSCELCGTPILAVGVENNPRHIYPLGQLMKCSCGTSRVWANSIRFPDFLSNWCDGKDVPSSKDPTVYGFCNDEFCPYCWGVWQCLKVGLVWKDGKHYDLFGCPKCEKNRHAIAFGSGRGRLGDADGQKFLAGWYRANQRMWRGKI